jgi:hypothetical protein
MPIAPGIKQCSYVRDDSRRCGSPAVTGEDRCYHHHRSRKPDPLSPELQDIVDIFQDPDFMDYLADVCRRCAAGTATVHLLQDVLSSIVGFDVRQPNPDEASSSGEYPLMDQQHMNLP